MRAMCADKEQTPTFVITLTDFNSQYIQAMRLFKDEPKWTPLNRNSDLDANTHRKQYVTDYLN